MMRRGVHPDLCFDCHGAARRPYERNHSSKNIMSGHDGEIAILQLFNDKAERLDRTRFRAWL